MSDAEGTGDVAPAPSGTEAPAQGQQQANPAPQGGGNPVYDGIRSKLGPSYSLVEPDLREWDRQAQERITKANAEAKRYAELGDFQTLSQAAQLQRLLQSDPKAVHDRLTQFLRQNGTLPPEVQAAVDAQEDDDSEEYDDPRFAQLQQSQQQIASFLADQQRQQAEAQALGQFESQMTSIRQQNPHFTDQDENRIYRMAYATAVSTDGEPDLAAAAAELNSMRTDFLSAPRPGSSAPRLVPSGGGQPPRGEATPYAKQNPQQTQQSVVEMLRANRAAQGY